jgi:hypothetical protein
MPRQPSRFQRSKKGDNVYLWCGKDWACFLTEDGFTVWCAWPTQGRLEKVADLKRLDLRGRYDPGGLHHVDFQALPNGDVLVLHELGLARLTPGGKLLWQRIHDQFPGHLKRLEANAVWLQGEELFGIRLSDGTPLPPP